jgi:hypothetical protein
MHRGPTDAPDEPASPRGSHPTQTTHPNPCPPIPSSPTPPQPSPSLSLSFLPYIPIQISASRARTMGHGRAISGELGPWGATTPGRGELGPLGAATRGTRASIPQGAAVQHRTSRAATASWRGGRPSATRAEPGVAEAATWGVAGKQQRHGELQRRHGG